jgi:hypothetical protein
MLKLAVTVTAFRPIRRGTLRGFATIFIAELHLIVHDVAVHQHVGGAHWVSLPARPVLDQDGQAKRNRDGRIEYATLLGFDSRAVSDAFSAAVITALLEFAPGAFDLTET